MDLPTHHEILPALQTWTGEDLPVLAVFLQGLSGYVRDQ